MAPLTELGVGTDGPSESELVNFGEMCCKVT